MGFFSAPTISEFSVTYCDLSESFFSQLAYFFKFLFRLFLKLNKISFSIRIFHWVCQFGFFTSVQIRVFAPFPLKLCRKVEIDQIKWSVQILNNFLKRQTCRRILWSFWTLLSNHNKASNISKNMSLSESKDRDFVSHLTKIGFK